jgi:Domain of unknown function (DUF4440)
MIEEGLVRQLTIRERSRRDGLVNDHLAGLADLLTDDLVHVHTPGMVQDKCQLMAHAGDFLRFAEVERGTQTIRSIGSIGNNAAIIAGSVTNTVMRHDTEQQVIVHTFVTQSGFQQDGRWRSSSLTGTFLPTHDMEA